MKKIALVLILCLVALAAGLGLALGPERAMAALGLGAEEAAHEAPEKEAHGAEAPPELTQNEMPLLPFPEMIVNVTDTTLSGRQTSRFLKANLILVYDEGEEGAGRLAERELYLRDAFQTFLRSLTVADLRGSAGMAMMKAELLRRARAVGDTDAPRDILVTDLVIQ